MVSNSELSLVSLKSIFRLPYQGAGWPLRFLIGTLLIFSGFVIPIVPWILVSGYGIRVMRRTIEGDELVLPAWDQWGAMAWDGVRATAITLIFLLPGFIVLLGGVGQYFLSISAIPFLGMAVEGGDGPAGLLGLLILGSFFIFFISLGLGNLLILLASIPLPVVTAHFAATNRFGAIIQIGTWARLLWRNKLGYLIVWVIGFGIIGILYFGFFFSYYLILPLCLIPFILPPAIFYILAIMQALLGETYREGRLLVD